MDALGEGVGLMSEDIDSHLGSCWHLPTPPLHSICATSQRNDPMIRYYIQLWYHYVKQRRKAAVLADEI